MKKYLYIFCYILIVACNKNDNPTPDDSGLFVKFFGNIFNDEGYSIEQTEDGGFLLVGTGRVAGSRNSDAIVIKMDKNGNFVDSVRISGNADYSARDIIKNEDNEYVVLCNKYYNDSSAVVLVKFSESLERRGEEYVIVSSNPTKKAKYLSKSSGNDVLVIGEFIASGVDKDMFILKTNLDTLYWQREIGLFNVIDSVGNIKETNDNYLVWCGSVFRNNGTQSDLRIVKSDDYGNLIWDYGYMENDNVKQYGHSIALLKDGGYIAAGGIDNADKDVYIVKTNADGQLQLFGQDNSKIIGGKGDQVANSIIETTSGDFILTGYTTDEDGGKDVYVVKMTKDGSVLWEKKLGGLTGDDVGNYIVECKDGGFIIVATVYVSNHNMMAVYKIDADGKLVR